jgi:hypothetical protein
MDIEINIANSNNNNQIEIEQTKFQKMVFLYNALDNGWSIKKRNNSYIFSKNHEGKKEIFESSYLSIFMKDNSNINNLLK